MNDRVVTSGGRVDASYQQAGDSDIIYSVSITSGLSVLHQPCHSYISFVTYPLCVRYTSLLIYVNGKM